jgi:UDP-N-acetylmuramate dehydrogenase
MHTSFRIGGPAELFLQPEDPAELTDLFSLLHRRQVPVFLLGGGANILVGDLGVRGVVVDLSALRGCSLESGPRGEPQLACLAGTPVSGLCAEALERGLTGLEFLYAMPGTVGGAVWMNARCYERSVADVLEQVEYITAEGRPVRYLPRLEEFGYKTSPFQAMDALILRAWFRTSSGDPSAIERIMREHKEDREAKGHFLWPCAGSVWKNNRSFGEPTGRIIDSLGLKGLRVGDAMVSDRHANIIVNLGEARAADVLAVMERVEAVVLERRGFRLEREILLVGDFGSG